MHRVALKWLDSHAPVLSLFLFPYRWHSPPVPTRTQSRSQQRCLRGWSNPKCCGLWAQCWLWSSSSSSSSPSCSLRSKRLLSVALHGVCVRLSCRDTCGCRFLLVASGMVMRHAPLCPLHRAAHTPNCNIQFPHRNIQCDGIGTDGRLICLSENPHFSPKAFGPVGRFLTALCEVSVEMAADIASLMKSTAWLSKTLS